ncbi:AGAP004016-PA-like protein [Anopheles sinensis]|uniref:AGAP004016-PA-like protein n=1 Tax=Anopheles sinensis TaxID=74873 RepID=A0A084VW31_ANOSI|nr:AGAP004016-PA-like protein [Anopheles sinensis]
MLATSVTCNVGTNVLWEHRCDPGSEVFACALPNFLYIPNENISRVVELDKAATRKISIHHQRRRMRDERDRDTILAYDAVMHEELKRPRAIQIARSRLKVVEIQLDLEYAAFFDGRLKEVIVPPTEKVYPLRYLDLNDNGISDIRNLSKLVNLETLDLSRNRLIRLNSEVFKGMTNLSTLSLAMNRISRLSYDVLPPKLESLYLHMNMLESADFTGAHLPVLEMCTFSYNFMTELEVSTVLAAMPNLKRIMLNHNDFGKHLEANISAALKEAGVAHDDGFGVEQTEHSMEYGDYGFEEDEEGNDDRFYMDRKAQLWEHTFSWLLTISNLAVLAWCAVVFYKQRKAVIQQPGT